MSVLQLFLLFEREAQRRVQEHSSSLIFTYPSCDDLRFRLSTIPVHAASLLGSSQGFSRDPHRRGAYVSTPGMTFALSATPVSRSGRPLTS